MASIGFTARARSGKMMIPCEGFADLVGAEKARVEQNLKNSLQKSHPSCYIHRARAKACTRLQSPADQRIVLLSPLSLYLRTSEYPEVVATALSALQLSRRRSTCARRNSRVYCRCAHGFCTIQASADKRRSRLSGLKVETRTAHAAKDTKH